MSAVKLTSAAALHDFVEDYSEDIIERGFYSFPTLDHMTILDDIKGKIVLTDLLIGDLAKRKSLTFQPTPNIIEFKPRILEVTTCDIDFEIFPAAFEKTYLGRFRQKGQKNKSIPFESAIFSRLLKKLKQELEFGVWNALAAVTPAAGDLLRTVFNGIKKMVVDIRAGGHAVHAVSGGTYTVSNILPNFRSMFEAMGANAEEMGVEAFGSRKVMNIFIDAYKAKHNGNKPEVMRNAAGVIMAVMLENGEGWFYCLPGLKASQMVIMTVKGNLFYGTDDLADTSNFDFKDQIKSIQFTTAFNVGVGIGIEEEEYFAFNDLN
jgi:hypothetical protein